MQVSRPAEAIGEAMSVADRLLASDEDADDDDDDDDDYDAAVMADTEAADPAEKSAPVAS